MIGVAAGEQPAGRLSQMFHRWISVVCCSAWVRYWPKADMP